MAELYLQKRGNMLTPVDSEGVETMAKIPEGRPLRAKVVVPRNVKFHRKAFALMDLAFNYWEPDTLVTQTEKATCIHLAEYLAGRGIDQDACYALTTDFLKALTAKRDAIDADKSKEAFRNWVTVEAGFYNVVVTPAGARKEPKSWSFSRMDDSTFAEMYKAIFGVCWNLVLSNHFNSEDEADNAVNALIGFDG